MTTVQIKYKGEVEDFYIGGVLEIRIGEGVLVFCTVDTETGKVQRHMVPSDSVRALILR